MEESKAAGDGRNTDTDKRQGRGTKGLEEAQRRKMLTEKKNAKRNRKNWKKRERRQLRRKEKNPIKV